MDLPEDTELTYIVGHEAWYAEANRRANPDPYLSVVCSYPDGGCAWEFQITEHDHSGGCVRVEMFDDAFDAWEQVPELFQDMRHGPTRSLDDVRDILDALGARDKTPREDPYATPSSRHAIVVVDRQTQLSRTALIMDNADEAQAKAQRDTTDRYAVVAVDLGQVRD